MSHGLTFLSRLSPTILYVSNFTALIALSSASWLELDRLSVVNSDIVGLVSELDVDSQLTKEDSVELQLPTSVSLPKFSTHSISSSVVSLVILVLKPPTSCC